MNKRLIFAPCNFSLLCSTCRSTTSSSMLCFKKCTECCYKASKCEDFLKFFTRKVKSMKNITNRPAQRRDYCCDSRRQRNRNWTDRQMEFIRYSKEDLRNLNRRNLQLICKFAKLNGSVKTSKIIENLVNYMDENNLPELLCFPFHTDYKSDKNVATGFPPLSIQLRKENVDENCRMYESNYPSVTSVLKATRSEKNLKNLAYWQKRELEAQGLENFNKMMQNTLDSGSSLHEIVANWLQSYQLFEIEKAEECGNKFSPFRTQEERFSDRARFFQYRLFERYEDQLFDDEKKTPESQRASSLNGVLLDIDSVLAVESGVIHEALGYAGTVDCIVEYKNEICLIDWKTCRRKKASWKSSFDYPVQLAAYAAAVNADPAYDFAVNKVAVVYANDDGSPAQVLTLSMEECLPYFYEWQGRLKRFKEAFVLEMNNFTQ